MSVGSWSPEGEKAKAELEISQQWLDRFIEISKNEQFDDISTLISPEDQQIQSGLMSLDKKIWFETAESLNEEQIKHLIRFFTVAEMQLAGWEAGNHSPVIWLTKALKKQGLSLEVELLTWIKANSDNRFLPHGSVL